MGMAFFFLVCVYETGYCGTGVLSLHFHVSIVLVLCWHNLLHCLLDYYMNESGFESSIDNYLDWTSADMGSYDATD